jgi:molybdopterin/thiamine biosynthesis adenylyltransferase
MKITRDVQQQAQPIQTPDGTSMDSLTVAQTEQLAARNGVSTKTIEIVALENNIVPLRYARNLKTTSVEEQVKLLKSRAAVVGLGGLGGTVVEVLARIGVGALDLTDGDAFEDHNLNRQLLSSQGFLGISKAKTARERLRAINASVDVTVHDFPLTPENASHVINNVNVVIDCLDNIGSRFTLQAAARQAAIPMVSAAVAGLTGHITTIFPEDKGLELIYGPADRQKSPKGAEITLGCLPQAVSLIASVESSEALKILLGKPQQCLSNKLLVVDLADNTFETLRLV